MPYGTQDPLVTAVGMMMETILKDLLIFIATIVTAAFLLAVALLAKRLWKMRRQVIGVVLSAAPIVAGLLLSGCASSGGFSRSYEMAVSQADAPELAGAITDFVVHQASPERPIVMDSPRVAGKSDVVTPLLRADLARYGYRVEADAPNANHIRWEIAPVPDTGVLLRISLNGGDAAKVFAKSKYGTLVPASPFMVRASAQ